MGPNEAVLPTMVAAWWPFMGSVENQTFLLGGFVISEEGSRRSAEASPPATTSGRPFDEVRAPKKNSLASSALRGADRTDIAARAAPHCAKGIAAAAARCARPVPPGTRGYGGP